MEGWYKWLQQKNVRLMKRFFLTTASSQVSRENTLGGVSHVISAQ